MEALGQLTGGIAHDFNNLLTAILGGLEVTRRRIEDPRSLRLIDSSISAAQRGAKLIAQLMAFARKQNLQVEYLPLNALVNDMKELLERSVGAQVRLIYDLTSDAWPVMADANQVQTALLNLAINARDAMPGGGTLRIATGNFCIPDTEPDLSAGGYSVLSVQDTGTGHVGSSAGEVVRAVLHDQGHWQGNRARAGSGLWLRAPVGWQRAGAQRGGRGDDVHHLAATGRAGTRWKRKTVNAIRASGRPRPDVALGRLARPLSRSYAENGIFFARRRPGNCGRFKQRLASLASVTVTRSPFRLALIGVGCDCPTVSEDRGIGSRCVPPRGYYGKD